MAPISSFLLFASIVACGIPTIIGKTHYPTVYAVTKRCDQTITVHGDIRFKLASTKYLQSPSECSMRFVPSTGRQLTAKFLTYNMDHAYTNEYGVCNEESIQLFDQAGTYMLSPYNADYCSKLKPSENYYLGNSGRFQVSNEGYPDTLTADVDILISEVSLKSDFFNSICPVSQFDCGNGYCVSDDVTCNGFDDCGNNKDENDCGSSMSPVIIGAIVVAIAFIIVAVVFLSLLICRQKRRAGYTQQA